MLFSNNALKENVKHAATYGTWSSWRDHFSILNNVINEYNSAYKMDLDNDADWFRAIMTGYQVWLMRAYINETLSESLGRTNNEDFFLLTLEEYLEKNTLVGNLNVVSTIYENIHGNMPNSMQDAERVYYKMLLAVAINRAKIYKNSNLEFFTGDIKNNIDKRSQL